MLIVIPVTSSGISNFPEFTNAIKNFGPYPGHQVIFASRESEIDQTKVLMDQISGLFDTSRLYVLKQECTDEAPQGPNFFWEDVCHYLQFELGNTLPWLWLGLDSAPIKDGWANSIETEYNLAKMPFLGAFKRDDDGEYLASTAVYPPNIGEFSILYSYASKIPTPFDVLCRWEFTPRAHKSKLFQAACEEIDASCVVETSKPVVRVADNLPSAPVTDVQLDADTLMPRRKRSRSVA
jgi:hypothetical protein